MPPEKDQQSPHEVLAQLRERLLRIIVGLTLAIATPYILARVFLYEELSNNITLTAYGLLLLVGVATKIPYKWRALAPPLAFMMVGAAELWAGSADDGHRLYFLASSVLAMLLSGRSAAYALVVLCAVTSVYLQTLLAKDPMIWGPSVIGTLLVSVVIVASVSFLLERLQQSETATFAALSAKEVSEARYRLITDNINGFIWITDLKLRYLYASPSGERLFGYTLDELMAGGMTLTTPAPSLQLLANTLEEELALEESGDSEPHRMRTFELQSLHKDGSVLEREVVAQCLRDKRGEVTGLLGVSRDITERKIATQALRNSERIVASSSDMLVLVGLRYEYLAVNAAFLKAVGKSTEEFLGKTIAEVLGEDFFETQVKAHIDRCLKGEHVRLQRNTKYPLAGELFMDITYAPDLDANGEIVGVAICGRDITHEHELESQLRQAQKMEAIGTLAGGIAHDFNNILQSIIGYSSIAQRDAGEDPEQLDKSLSEIANGARRAAALVNQMLTFSRISKVEFLPSNLQPIVEECLGFLRNSMPSTIEIESQFDDEVSAVIADETQIHQVVTNLCTNAMAAFEDGKGVVRVSLTSCNIELPTSTRTGILQPGDYSELKVSDTGQGIPPADLDRIFDPFFTTKEVGKGTGLGLASLHGIIKGMGGGVRVESEMGNGTTFRILFPTTSETPRNPDLVDKANDIETEIGLRVLHVDDEQAILDLTAIFLEARGCTVESHLNATTALESILKNPDSFDVVLTDYTMPGITGVELAGELESQNPSIPVILVTGLLESEFESESRPANIASILNKPFREEGLWKSLIGAVGKRVVA